jgi:hypothetical protein
MRETLSDSFIRVDWDSALSKVARKIASTSPGRVALYLSGQMGTEDYYIANKLGKGFIGTPHVDTNSLPYMYGQCRSGLQKEFRSRFRTGQDRGFADGESTKRERLRGASGEDYGECGQGQSVDPPERKRCKLPDQRSQRPVSKEPDYKYGAVSVERLV